MLYTMAFPDGGRMDETTPAPRQRKTPPPGERISSDPLGPFPCAASHDFSRFHLDCPGWGWCLVCERCGTLMKTDPLRN
jgi:hypothetical protein